VADRYRVDYQPAFIDQSIVDQGVHEDCAAVGEDHTAGFALERADVLGQTDAISSSVLRPMMCVPASRNDATFHATISSSSGGSP